MSFVLVQDYIDAGISESGTYEIDPDGGLYGEPPFFVHCNFETGLQMVYFLFPSPVAMPLKIQNWNILGHLNEAENNGRKKVI